MTKAKRVKKNVSVPCTDANQRVIERINRIKKQREWQTRKLEELKEKIEASRKAHEKADALKEDVANLKIEENVEPLNLDGAYNRKEEE